LEALALPLLLHAALLIIKLAAIMSAKHLPRNFFIKSLLLLHVPLGRIPKRPLSMLF
jgi:hypothetical protein